MREFGIFLMIIGSILGIYAYTSDTSVNAGISGLGVDRISNLSMMNDQQNLIIIAGILAIIGAILLVGGSLIKQLEIPAPLPAASRVIVSDYSDDLKLTDEQKELKAKFERAEISLAEYQERWNKSRK